MLLYGEWVEENVLAPVPHRQYVFTVPRLLRPIFARHREWRGELCRIAARLLADAYEGALPGARPGLILFAQTFGDWVNFNPHLHVLADAILDRLVHNAHKIALHGNSMRKTKEKLTAAKAAE